MDDVDTCCQVLVPIHLGPFSMTFSKGHDMCYDTIDKSGLCDGLHPALVTYEFEPAANGTLACTDCSGEDLLNEQSSDEEVACHCKVIGQRDERSPKNHFDLHGHALVTFLISPDMLL